MNSVEFIRGVVVDSTGVMSVVESFCSSVLDWGVCVVSWTVVGSALVREYEAGDEWCSSSSTVGSVELTMRLVWLGDWVDDCGNRASSRPSNSDGSLLSETDRFIDELLLKDAVCKLSTVESFALDVSIGAELVISVCWVAAVVIVVEVGSGVNIEVITSVERTPVDVFTATDDKTKWVMGRSRLRWETQAEASSMKQWGLTGRIRGHRSRFLRICSKERPLFTWTQREDHKRFTDKWQKIKHPTRWLPGQTLLHCRIRIRRRIQSLDGNRHIRCSSEDRTNRAVSLNKHYENHRFRGDVPRRRRTHSTTNNGRVDLQMIAFIRDQTVRESNGVTFDDLPVANAEVACYD